MAMVKTTFDKLGKSVRAFVSASSRAVCQLKKEGEAMQILYTGTKHALRHTQKRLFNVHGKKTTDWVHAQALNYCNVYQNETVQVYIYTVKNLVSVRSGTLDPEDVVFPDEEPGYEDETERRDLERFLRSVHQGAEARTVDEEVQEIFETVDKVTPFRRGKAAMTWPTVYYDDKDNYHGTFAEGADPTVLFSTRSKLERFQSTRTGKDVRLFE
jgi:hypothetical protein